MILQLNPAIPLRHPEKGNFLAHFIHDSGIENQILFTGFLENNGEIWTFNNTVLRAQKNITIGRVYENKYEKDVSAFCPNGHKFLIEECTCKSTSLLTGITKYFCPICGSGIDGKFWVNDK